MNWKQFQDFSVFYFLSSCKISRTLCRTLYLFFSRVWVIFVLTLASLSTTPVLPVLLPAGHAGGHRVHQDKHVSEGTAAHPGSGGLPGSLPARLRPKVRLPRWPPIQRHQVSTSADTSRANGTALPVLWYYFKKLFICTHIYGGQVRIVLKRLICMCFSTGPACWRTLRSCQVFGSSSFTLYASYLPDRYVGVPPSFLFFVKTSIFFLASIRLCSFEDKWTHN